MEKKINEILEEEMFVWNSKLINIGIFRNGFALVTVLGLIPIYTVCFGYIAIKFMERIIDEA